MLVSSRLVSSRLDSPFAPSVLAGVICAVLSLASPQGYADESVWVEVLPDAVADSRVQARRVSKPVLTEQLEKYRLFSLDEQRLEGQLSVVTAARSAAPDTASGMEISLPLPDGSFAKVEVVGTDMFPDDAEAQAEFKTWEVRSLDGKVLGGVLDFSDAGGFHAMLELRNGDTVFVDPLPLS